jgi:hypothetical protein
MNQFAALFNLACLGAAFYFGYDGKPWYWVLGLGIMSAAISVEKFPNEKMRLVAAALPYVLATAISSAFFLAIFFVAVWLGYPRP